MRALPLPDNSVDVVASCHTLTDVPDAGAAIQEFARVLRPGGRLVVLVVHSCFYGQRAEREVTMAMPNAADYFGQRVVCQPFSMWWRNLTGRRHHLLWAPKGLVLVDIRRRPGPHPGVRAASRSRTDGGPLVATTFPSPAVLLLGARKD
jgi:SAM-dependent methyltransferase